MRLGDGFDPSPAVGAWYVSHHNRKAEAFPFQLKIRGQGPTPAPFQQSHHQECHQVA
jgi:hypothetical protein